MVFIKRFLDFSKSFSDRKLFGCEYRCVNQPNYKWKWNKINIWNLLINLIKATIKFIGSFGGVDFFKKLFVCDTTCRPIWLFRIGNLDNTPSIPLWTEEEKIFRFHSHQFSPFIFTKEEPALCESDAPIRFRYGNVCVCNKSWFVKLIHVWQTSSYSAVCHCVGSLFVLLAPCE